MLGVLGRKAQANEFTTHVALPSCTCRYLCRVNVPGVYAAGWPRAKTPR